MVVTATLPQMSRYVEREMKVIIELSEWTQRMVIFRILILIVSYL